LSHSRTVAGDGPREMVTAPAAAGSARSRRRIAKASSRSTRSSSDAARSASAVPLCGSLVREPSWGAAARPSNTCSSNLSAPVNQAGLGADGGGHLPLTPPSFPAPTAVEREQRLSPSAVFAASAQRDPECAPDSEPTHCAPIARFRGPTPHQSDRA
jgi:hypothetical protein